MSAAAVVASQSGPGPQAGTTTAGFTAATTSANAQASRSPPPPPSAELLSALEQLGQQLQGSLSLHEGASTHRQGGDHNDGPAPTVWNELCKGDTPAFRAARPLCWVRCASERDVALAVAFAVRHGIKLSGKGAGHHYGGACMSEGGMVLDLSRLKGVRVDADRRMARIEPGLTTQELREATIAHGLHFPGGHISGVGCAGFILGGGNGWGCTKWGAAVDNVIEFEVILPTVHSQGAEALLPALPSQGSEGGGGERELQPLPVTRVTAESDPDLFAALKGAGMFVGVVTAFHVRLHPVPSSIPTITAVYPVSCAPQALALMQEVLLQGPTCVEPSVALVRGAAPDRAPLTILGASAFGHADDPLVQETFAKVRALLPGQRHSLKQECLPYLQALAVLDGAYVGPRLCMYAHGMFVEHRSVTPTFTQAMMDAAAGMTSNRSLLLMVPSTPSSPEPSSLDFRDMLFVCAYSMWQRTDAGPEADGDEAHAAWVRGVRDAVGTAAAGTYVNEVMLEPGQVASCYKPETLARVARVKARTDPQGLLRALDA